MTSIESGYDISSTTFSPDGTIFQIEYASKLVSRSPIVIGLICKDGILIASEKSNLINQEKSFETFNIFRLNINAAIGATGISNDIKYTLSRSRIDSRNYQKFFSDTLTGKLLISRICSFFHIYTLYSHIRPLACSLIIGTSTQKIPELYTIFLTGYFIKCFASVIGKNCEIIKSKIFNAMINLETCRKNVENVIRIVAKFKFIERIKSIEICCFSRENISFDYPISCNLSNESQRLRLELKLSSIKNK